MTEKKWMELVNGQMGSEALRLETDGPLSRAKAAAMMAGLKCLGLQPQAAARFADAADIPEEYKGEVGAIAAYGYLHADEGGDFRPLDELGEAEAEEMLRMANPGRQGARAYTKQLRRPAGHLDVEQLWFRVNHPDFYDRWAELDEKYWTRFLMSWDAIGRKDYWMSEKKPGHFCTVIYGPKPVWKGIGPERGQALDKRYIAEMGEENYHFDRGETDYQVVAYVANQDFVQSREVVTAKLLRPMAVEELKFRLATPDLLETWLQADHSIWTQSLAQNDGFYRKDIWQSTVDPCIIKTVIYWRSQEDWMAYDHRLLAPLDAKMEAALGQGNCEFVAGEHEENGFFCRYRAE